MDAPKHFLVVDDNADSRFLLVKTLLRKFPTAIIRECQECADAVKIARLNHLAAIPHVIILMVSGLDRTESAIRAGATCFLNYDEWLRVGSLVTDLLSRAAKPVAAMEPRGQQTELPFPDRPGVSRPNPTSLTNE